MPTLIRLVVVLLVLIGIGFGAMFALVMTVHPKDKDVVIRIPAKDLVPSQTQVERREIDTSSKPVAPATTSGAPADTTTPGQEPPAMPPEQPDDNSPDVQTLTPGTE